MLHLLKTENYEKARSVLESLDIHLAVQAVLKRCTSGEIYADQEDRPQSALISVGQRFFLAGSPHNKAFNHELSRLFADNIFPAALAKGKQGFSLYYDDPAWEEKIYKVIFPNHYPIRAQRQYYTFQKNQNRGYTIPAGASLHPVDRKLLEMSQLSNLDDLMDEMQSERESVEDFLEKSFGICLLQEGQLESWCLSEYNCGSRCEVGIATAADFQRRGYATLVASAFIEKAYSLGINLIGWHCYTDNIPSVATALKAGFEKNCDYTICYAWFDPVANLCLNGNSCLKQGQYAAALQWHEKAFRLGAAPNWAYYEAACASAMLGNPDGAFDYLNQAIQHGFMKIKRFQESPYLNSLHDNTQWKELMRSGN